MAECAVVVAEYHAVRRHASAILTDAGFRVVGASNLDAAYWLARLYRARVVVFQAFESNLGHLVSPLADLRADPTTAGASIILLGSGAAPTPGVLRADVLDGPGLLRAVEQALAPNAAAS